MASSLLILGAEDLVMSAENELQRQTCKACHCADKFNYHVPDSLWKAIVPKRLQLGTICLECFDRFASEKGITYADALDALYFAGDKAAMELKVVDAHDL
jgi:hypothetical protein